MQHCFDALKLTTRLSNSEESRTMPPPPATCALYYMRTAGNRAASWTCRCSASCRRVGAA
jgi:hypothetical protein